MYQALIDVDKQQWEAEEKNEGVEYTAPEFDTWVLANCDHMMNNICEGIIAARQSEFDAAEGALLSILISSIRPKHDLKHIRSCKTGSEAYRLLVSVFSGANALAPRARVSSGWHANTGTRKAVHVVATRARALPTPRITRRPHYGGARFNRHRHL